MLVTAAEIEGFVYSDTHLSLKYQSSGRSPA